MAAKDEIPPVARPFELETAHGFRRLEFDPDPSQRLDVRILVDGRRVAEMPYPKAETPFHELAFEIDGNALVAATWRPAVLEANGAPARSDLFFNGKSLTDGTDLAVIRARESVARRAYPQSFLVLNMAIRVIPGAATPGLFLGASHSATEAGWPKTIVILGVMLAALLAGTAAANAAWRHIRDDERWSVRRRVAYGWLAVLGSFIIPMVVFVALIVPRR